MNDLTEIKNRVRQYHDLAHWIRADGVELRQQGSEWKAKCPFHEDGTPSFTVFQKDGTWRFHCFGCEADGDIFEYIMRRRNVDFMTALKSLAFEAGIALPIREQQENKSRPEPRVFDAGKFAGLIEGGKVWKYLTEGRKLDGELLRQYSVGETADGAAYCFAYKWVPQGAPANQKPRFEFAKVVKVDRIEGKKEEWREPKGGKNILFGMCAPLVMEAHKTGGELVICEGELDAISWAQFGFAAVSVPCGAKALNWIDHCFEWLQAFKKIHISFDEDAAGRMKVAEIVTRLGMSRTDIVRLPTADGQRLCKDANECLQAAVPTPEMKFAVDSAEILRPAKLKSIYDFETEIWNKLHNTSAEYLGLPLPWGNFNKSSLPFRFRLGEVTVWTGYNKHGKSEVLNHVIVDLCFRHGERATICSLEVKAAETYRKLLRMVHALPQALLREVPRERFGPELLLPLKEKIWVYDHVGYARVDDALNVMLYSYQRYGCRHFVLDSLMKFDELDGDGQQQWNNQRDFMSKLTTFAETNNVHVHLVAHSKKPADRQGEGKIPRRYDINGSGYISNLPHNVIVVWRNRPKQDKLEEAFQHAAEAWLKHFPEQDAPEWRRMLGGPPADNAPHEIRVKWNQMMDIMENHVDKKVADRFLEEAQEHDSYVIVDAQRGGDGDTPARRLWFHYDTLQFIEKSAWDKNGPAALKEPTNYIKISKQLEEENSNK